MPNQYIYIYNLWIPSFFHVNPGNTTMFIKDQEKHIRIHHNYLPELRVI